MGNVGLIMEEDRAIMAEGMMMVMICWDCWGNVLIVTAFWRASFMMDFGFVWLSAFLY